MNNTLRQALRKTRELRQQVENLLLGDEGDIYEAELKKFVTKRPCWIPEGSTMIDGPLLPKTRMAPRLKYELYLHDSQKDGGNIRSSDLEKHLKETGRLVRALSLESELVKSWRENPRTYPNELKDKAVFLWGSTEHRSGDPYVALLVWVGSCVDVRFDYPGGNNYLGGGPALLALT